jgi:hypothetical protein
MLVAMMLLGCSMVGVVALYFLIVRSAGPDEWHPD